MRPYDPSSARRFARSLVPGQRVKARFDGGPEREGVVSGELRVYTDDLATVPVQFEPCGAHYGCYDVSPFGDAAGWTDREYRIAREAASSYEHAEHVEAERRERYPDAPFSMMREAVAV